MRDTRLRYLTFALLLLITIMVIGWQPVTAETSGACTHPEIRLVTEEAATCQKTGMKKHYICETCRQLFKDAKGKKKVTVKALTVKKKKHSYKEKKADADHLKMAATCTKPAVYYYSCKMCHEKGKKTFKSGKALGHKFENSITKATLSKDGSIGQKCTVCGKRGIGKKIYKASKIALPKKYKKGMTYVGNNGEKPAIEVRNSKKKNIASSEYEITYQNSYDPKKGTGTGKATVSFKGINYQGSKVIEYKIINVPVDAGSSEDPQDQHAKEMTVDDLPYSDTIIYNKPFALINEYNAFLSVASDNDTLILSNKPYMWKLAKGKTGSHIVSAADPELMFDLDNANYSAGNRVHLYEDTGNACQYWNLTQSGEGWVITSAEKPEWCIASAETGFSMEKSSQADKNDTWKIVTDGDWAKSFTSPASSPFMKIEGQSYTPTPDFWGKFDVNGITDDMKAGDTGSGDIYAQYANASPVSIGSADNFDFFSVEFYTDTQPDYTYWSLANWMMDCSEYMKQNDYTDFDTDGGAYAGLQDTGDKTTKIMSIWEIYFTKSDGTRDTLVPKCVYPEGESTYFDGEGNGTSLVAPFEWKPKTWYRFVLRTWENGDTTYAGTWVEDLSTGKITLLAVYDTLLPNSSISGVPSQFLENFSPESHGEYRQMKLRNYCLRTSDSAKWISPNAANMSIWATLELDNRGTYRFSADEESITVETCGLGEDVCKGMSDEDTFYTVKIKPAASVPDVSRYEIPDL